jgi:hypothetical protein
MWYFTSNFQKIYAREKLPESLCNPILTPYAVNLCYVYPAKERRQNNQSHASDATCERDRNAFPQAARLPIQGSPNRWEPVGQTGPAQFQFGSVPNRLKFKI